MDDQDYLYSPIKFVGFESSDEVSDYIKNHLQKDIDEGMVNAWTYLYKDKRLKEIIEGYFASHTTGIYDPSYINLHEHTWLPYQGLTETYDYCECGEKKCL